MLVLSALERWDIVLVLATILGIASTVIVIYNGLKSSQDKQTASLIATQDKFSAALDALKETVTELRTFVKLSNDNLGTYIERNEQEHKEFMKQLQAQSDKIVDLDKSFEVCKERNSHE